MRRMQTICCTPYSTLKYQSWDWLDLAGIMHMQLADLSELMRLGKPGPQAAAGGSPPAPLDAAQPEPELSEGPAAATPAPEQVGSAMAVANLS